MNSKNIIRQHTQRNCNTIRIKKLYGCRWKIETNYDGLKNKLHIEKFSGRKKIIIEQDFYSHIYLFNVLIALKHDAEQQITRKPNKQQNINTNTKPTSTHSSETLKKKCTDF